MHYKCLAAWRDLSDGHLYLEGDQFPFDGREIAPERLAELESGRNRAGLRLIQADDAGNERAEALKEEAPKQAENGRKTAPKRRTAAKK